MLQDNVVGALIAQALSRPRSVHRGGCRVCKDKPMGKTFEHDIVVVGGCGHVGLPLGIVFAASGQRVLLYDTNAAAVELVSGGHMPFEEPGAHELLQETVGKGLEVTSDPSSISGAEHIVVVIGTPIDEHLNPDPTVVATAIEELAEYLVPGQLIVLRSTIYPGSTAVVEKMLARLGVAGATWCSVRNASQKARRSWSSESCLRSFLLAPKRHFYEPRTCSGI